MVLRIPISISRLENFNHRVLQTSPLRNHTCTILAIVLLTLGSNSVGQEFHDGFESTQVAFEFLETNAAAFRQIEHVRTDSGAHSGSSSEILRFEKKGGTRVLYGYKIKPIYLISDLQPSIWLKSNAPGISFRARVVLPNTPDHDGRGKMSTFVDAPIYSKTGKWQKLTFENNKLNVEKLLQEQVVKLARRYGKIDSKGAFVDMLVIDAGVSNNRVSVAIDDLEIKGVVPLESIKSSQAKSNLRLVSHNDLDSFRKVQRVHNVLEVDDRPLHARVIEHRGERLKFLKELGFNTVKLTKTPSESILKEARDADIWLICPPPPSLKTAPIAKFEDVLCWSIGDQLGQRDLELSRRRIGQIRRDDQLSRPVIGNIASRSLDYFRICDVASFALEPMGTTFEMTDVSKWIESRLNLGNNEKPVFIQINTQFSPKLTEQIATLSGSVPQMLVNHLSLKSLTWQVISSGARGIIFSSTSSLESNDAETRFRRDTLKWLNLQLQQIEPWIAGSKSNTPVRSGQRIAGAKILKTENSALVLLYDNSLRQQIVGQYSVVQQFPLTIEVDTKTQRAFYLTESGVKPVVLKQRGDRSVAEIGEFCLAGAVALTNDAQIIRHLSKTSTIDRQKQILELHQDLSGRLLTLANRTHDELNEWGVGSQEATVAFKSALESLYASERAFKNQNLEAVRQNQIRADQQLFGVMRAAIDSSSKTFTSPTASPLFFSYQTLPLHYELSRRLKSAQWQKNSLPVGDFEDLQRLKQAGWQQFKISSKNLRTRTSLISQPVAKGQLALELSCETVAGSKSLPIESTPTWATSPKIKVQGGQVLRIHGYLRIDQPIRRSYDGVMIIDSLGAPALAARFSKTNGWQEFTMYRAVASDGEFHLTLALTGEGKVVFDEIEVNIAKPASPTYRNKKRKRRMIPVSNR